MSELTALLGPQRPIAESSRSCVMVVLSLEIYSSYVLQPCARRVKGKVAILKSD